MNREIWHTFISFGIMEKMARFIRKTKPANKHKSHIHCNKYFRWHFSLPQWGFIDIQCESAGAWLTVICNSDVICPRAMGHFNKIIFIHSIPKVSIVSALRVDLWCMRMSEIACESPTTCTIPTTHATKVLSSIDAVSSEHVRVLVHFSAVFAMNLVILLKWKMCPQHVRKCH